MQTLPSLRFWAAAKAVAVGSGPFLLPFAEPLWEMIGLPCWEWPYSRMIDREPDLDLEPLADVAFEESLAVGWEVEAIALCGLSLCIGGM